MHMTSLTLLLALSSGMALVGCESHDHHRSDTGSYESNRQQMTSDTKYDDRSAVSTGGAAGAGINDNRNVNRSETPSDAPRAGSAMTPEEKNRTAQEGPSASNGDTNHASDADRSTGSASVGPNTGSNQSGSMDNTTPRAGSGTASGITDNNNVNRSDNTPATQPAPRSASDQ